MQNLDFVGKFITSVIRDVAAGNDTAVPVPKNTGIITITVLETVGTQQHPAVITATQHGAGEEYCMYRLLSFAGRRILPTLRGVEELLVMTSAAAKLQIAFYQLLEFPLYSPNFQYGVQETSAESDYNATTGWHTCLDGANGTLAASKVDPGSDLLVGILFLGQGSVNNAHFYGTVLALLDVPKGQAINAVPFVAKTSLSYKLFATMQAPIPSNMVESQEEPDTIIYLTPEKRESY